MKKAVLITIAVAASALALAQMSNPASPIETADQALAADYDGLNWARIVPELGEGSPEIAIVHVDPNTKATELFIRNQAPVHVPMHWHSANETHTVIRGTMVFEHHGQRHTLGPGGFNYIPKKTHHQAWLPANGLVFITVDAAWDVNWVSGPPTERDLGPGAVEK